MLGSTLPHRGSPTHAERSAQRRLRAPDYVADRFRTALSIVAAGLGVMVVPAIVAGGVPDGSTLVDIDHPELHRTVGALHRPDGGHLPLLDTLIDHLVDGVKGIPEVRALTT